mgnify:CR=1 FL=1
MRWWIFAFILPLTCLASDPAVNETKNPLDPQSWLDHVKEDLAPYWLHEDALGLPSGNYPTYRCPDGTAISKTNGCGFPVPQDLFDYAQQHQFTRMLSRQVFTYGVLFQLTGDKNALAAMKSGVDYLIAHKWQDQGRRGMISLTRNGQPMFEEDQRTSQDLAYGLLGPAFYYYLTRDEEVLPYIVNVKDYIFGHYFNSQQREIYWVKADSEQWSPLQRELVAQLDQINSYLLLLTPILPEKFQTQWKKDLRLLGDLLWNYYFNAEDMRFYGGIHHKSATMIGARHNDYGHTIKAFWMLFLSGQILNENDWVELATIGLSQTLADAYLEIYGESVWSEGPRMGPASWWTFAELDQAAATIWLNGDQQGKDWLSKTSEYWLRDMVDKKHGGVWMSALAPRNGRDPKQFEWKNGYHEAEHALVLYLVTSAMTNQKIQLYFAHNLISDRAYFFSAKQLSSEKISESLYKHTYQLLN